MDAAPASGAAEVASRTTALPRPWIVPRLIAADRPGHAPDDPAVRRYWTALIGPGAVADLLRLTASARNGRPIRRPLHLGLLLHEGLIGREAGHILVHRNVPMMTERHLRRLPASLRVEYRGLIGGAAPPRHHHSRSLG